MANYSVFSNPSDSVEMSYAGFWWRFLAYVIDSILLTIVFLILNLMLSLVLGPDINQALAKTDPLHALNGMAFGVKLIVNNILQALYFIFLESSEKQGSIGKMICGLQVTSVEGERISTAQATGRYFSKIISSLAFVGYIMAAFTQRKQALHDLIAKTVVLKMSDV